MSDDDRTDDVPARRDDRRPPGPLEREMDEFDDDEFGGPLFGATTEQPVTSPDDDVEPLSFGGDESGPLPHWTDPPTGEVPSIPSTRQGDPTDDLDVWSSFASDPVPRSGTDREPAAPDASTDPSAPKDPTGELVWHDDDPTGAGDTGDDAAAEVAAGAVGAVGSAAASGARREPARITIGTDPSGMPRRPDTRGRRGGSPQRPPGRQAPAPAPDGRNLPVAVASGLVLAAVFLALAMWRPAGALAFVVVALAVASFEYFARVADKGYRPAVAAGVAACVAAPLAAYWAGETGLLLVVVFAFVAAALGFIADDSVEAGPMPNIAITMLGIVWIGVLGAFAALILSASNFGSGTPWGTDTLVLVAIGVVANDVGAYFVGSAFGRTPLRSWISPNKSFEGLLGGTALTLLVLFLIGLQDLSDTWSSTSHLLILGIVISVLAPIGDLTESMFKRNLDVKDFGAVIRGHGGVLDRFDGFLFVLPGVYYTMRVLEPWLAG